MSGCTVTALLIDSIQAVHITIALPALRQACRLVGALLAQEAAGLARPFCTANLILTIRTVWLAVTLPGQVDAGRLVAGTGVSWTLVLVSWVTLFGRTVLFIATISAVLLTIALPRLSDALTGFALKLIVD